jgi:uncharacterized protein
VGTPAGGDAVREDGGPDPLPAAAAWRHHTARSGFEVAFLEQRDDEVVLRGECSAVESGQPWSVHYDIRLWPDWSVRTAHVTSHSLTGFRQVRLRRRPSGWWVDGRPAPELDGCADLDLDASVLTNALPVRRLSLGVDESAEAPAAFVAAADLGLSPMQQRYRRLADDGQLRRYDYVAPGQPFRARLSYDATGLVVDYPGIATRVL